MVMMGQKRFLAVVLGACLAQLGCKSATQAKIGLHTNLAYEEGVFVDVWASGPEAPAGPPQVSVRTPWTADGRIGDFVLVPPSENREARFALRAVLALGRDPATCTVQDARNCIIARRTSRYLRGQSLQVPISLYAQCLGVACDETTTCNSLGRCVPADVDPVACTSEGGCVVSGDPPTPPTVQPRPVPVPVDAGADAEILPVELPPESPSAAYRDQTPVRGLSQGKLTLNAASGGPPAVGYEVQWSDEQGSTFAPLIEGLYPAPKTATEPRGIEHVVLPGTVVPLGLDHFSLRSFSWDRAGNRLWSPPARIRADNYVRMLDLGGEGGVDGFTGGIRLGPAADEFTLAGIDTGSHPTLRRCKLDGSSCTSKLLSSTLVTARGLGTVIDVASNRLLMAITNNANEVPYLLACKADGSDCVERDLYAMTGLSGRQAMSFTGMLDQAASMAVFVTTSSDTGRHLMFRCDLDGKACALRIMEDEAGIPHATYGYDFSPAIDAASRTLVMASSDATSGAPAGRQHLALFRCKLDEAGCTYADLSAQTGSFDVQELRPKLVVDDAARKVRITTTGFPNAGRARVFSANIDGTEATVRDLAAQFGFAQVSYSATSFDATNQKLLFMLGSSSRTPTLLRCAPDGSACSSRDLAAGGTFSSIAFYNATVVASPNTDRVLVCASNPERQDRPWLFSCPTNGLACGQADLSVAAQRGNIVGRRNGVEWSIHGAVDLVNKQLVVVGSGSASEHTPILIRCGLDAKGCVTTNASADQPVDSGFFPSVVALPAGDRAVVASADYQPGRSGRPSLFFCPSSGAGCTWRDASAGLTSIVGGNPLVGVVPSSARVRVLSGGRVGFNDQAYLVDCDPNGLDCTGTKLGSATSSGRQAALFDDGEAIAVLNAGALLELSRCTKTFPTVCTNTPFAGPPVPAAYTSLRYDDIQRVGSNQWAIAGTLRGPGEPAFMLAICDATLSACNTRVFTVAPGVLRYGSNVLGAYARLVVDAATNMVYLAHSTTSALVAVGATELWRCAAADLVCERLVLSNEVHTAVPVPVIDRLNGRLHLLASNASTGRRPVSFVVDLW